MRDPLDSWFKLEVLPHEAALLGYLNRIWRNKPAEISDLRQEIYARVYEAARRSRPNNARAFLFSTARHLVVDRVRRQRVISIEAVGDSEALNVLIDEISPERKLSAWQELRRVVHALNTLPPRCREVIWLRKVHEQSTKEVAAHLKISERTVEGQILKGMRMLSDALLTRAPDGTKAESQETGVGGVDHGDP